MIDALINFNLIHLKTNNKSRKSHTVITIILSIYIFSIWVKLGVRFVFFFFIRPDFKYFQFQNVNLRLTITCQWFFKVKINKPKNKLMKINPRGRSAAEVGPPWPALWTPWTAKFPKNHIKYNFNIRGRCFFSMLCILQNRSSRFLKLSLNERDFSLIYDWLTRRWMEEGRLREEYTIKYNMIIYI